MKRELTPQEAKAKRAFRRPETLALADAAAPDANDVFVARVGRRSWKKLPDAPLGEYVAARLNVREEIGMNDGARDGPCWLPAASARGSARS
jgi:hypothetical protein